MFDSEQKQRLMQADKNHKTSVKNGSQVLLILGVNMLKMKVCI